MFAGSTSSDIISNGIRYITIPNKFNDVFGKCVLVIRDIDDELNYNLRVGNYDQYSWVSVNIPY